MEMALRGLQAPREKVMACAELLEMSGWCVALRLEAGKPWLGANARRCLSSLGLPDAEVTWTTICRVAPKLAASPDVLIDESAVIWRAWDGAAIPPPPTVNLTKRETEVLSLLRMGKTNTEIAIILGCSRRTAEKHAENIYRKLGVKTHASAVFSEPKGDKEP